MKLTPDEEKEIREEIEYTRETQGDDFVWGEERTKDKVINAIRGASDKIANGVNRLANSPTLNKINEGAREWNRKLCEQEAAQKATQNTQKKRRPRQDTSSNYSDGLSFGNDHL
jgi:hypothetical protein